MKWIFAALLFSYSKVRTIGDEAFTHNPIIVSMIDSVCNG